MKRKTEIDKEGLNELIHLSKKLLKIFYVILLIAIVLGILITCNQLKIFSFLKGIFGVVSPVFFGFALAWLFYPFHKKLLSKKVNKVLSAIIIFFLIVLCMFVFIYIFVPVLYNQINDLVSYIPSATQSVADFVSKKLGKFEISGFDTSSVRDSILTISKNYIVKFTSNLPNQLVGMVKGIVSALGVIVFSIIVGIYMLIDFDNIKKGIKKLLPKNEREDYIKLFQNIEINARRVVNGTLLVALVVFALDTLGFAVMGLNASVLFGLFCGITDLIPYIGPYIGGAAAVIVGFTQGPIIGIGTLVIAVFVQLLESYVLQPMVMSKAMQLHPVVIIIGLLLFGYFFGIIGMIIATPCMAIIKEICLFINRKRKDKKTL